MFNVGDEVIIVSDVRRLYDYSHIGSYGVVIEGEQYGQVRVAFNFINNPIWSGEAISFAIHVSDLEFNRPEDKANLVTLKIRSIYARQKRKTGYSFL